MVTDQSQAVVWQTEQTPFGEVIQTTGTLAQPLRFPGQYADPETGYSYNYFRDYDPSVGRYVQSDPIGLLGGPNTYGYVDQNPWINTDQFGLIIVAVRFEISDSFVVFHYPDGGEHSCGQVEDSYDGIQYLGMYQLDNSPCYFICYFTDQAWRDMEIQANPYIQ